MAIGDLPTTYAFAQEKPLNLKDSLTDLFHSKALNYWMKQSLQNNPSFQSIAMDMESAGWLVKKSQASLFPSINAILGNNKSKGLTSTTTSYNASLDASWEIDLWGRLKDTRNAQVAQLRARVEDYHAARQSLVAQTTQAYFALIEASELLKLSKQTVASYQKTKKLILSRYNAGKAQASDLHLADNDLANSQATLHQRVIALHSASRTLFMLAGQYPKGNAQPPSWPRFPRAVAAGIPSTLLMARPDIRAAYLRIVAADKKALAAYKNLFPQFSLTASSGKVSSSLRQWAHSGGSIWSLAGSVVTPLVDFGARRAALGEANTEAKKALIAYKQVVLNAFNEVEEALESQQNLALREIQVTQALRSAQSAHIALERSYSNGLTEVLSLLEAQRRVFLAKEQCITLKAQRYASRVNLALALGKAY